MKEIEKSLERTKAPLLRVAYEKCARILKHARPPFSKGALARGATPTGDGANNNRLGKNNFDANRCRQRKRERERRVEARQVGR